MKKGIIMEINKDFLTLLTPDGQFLRACNHQKHYVIGQEIDFFPVSQDEKKFSLIDYLQGFKGKNIFAAALLCVFIFAAIFPFFSGDKVYAYMSIDVNPSIELGVNDKFQVIEIIPYNNEGKLIIASIPEWKKKNIHELTSEIIHEIKVKGYIKNNHEVLLATISENELDKNERWKKEMAEIKTIVSNEHLELKVIEGSKEEREKAKKKGLTTGIYKENQQLKANKSTSQFDKKSEQDETSEIGNKNEKQAHPSHDKKPELIQQSKQGFEKSENKQKYEEKQVPPGQVKKKEKIEKQSSNNSEQQSNKKQNQNNKKEKFENRQKHNDGNKQQEHHQKQKYHNDNNQHRQQKESNNNGNKD